MITSFEFMMPMDDILFGGIYSMNYEMLPPEQVTDEIKHHDRYAYYSAEGAYYNDAFCKICDMTALPIGFHQLRDYHAAIGGKEKAEIFVYHARKNPQYFAAFDLWWGRTDQCGMTVFAMYYETDEFPQISHLSDRLVEKAWQPHMRVRTPSELAMSVLSESNGTCMYQGRTYTVKHFY